MSTPPRITPAHRIVATCVAILQCFWLPQAHPASYYWDADGNAANNDLSGAGLGGTAGWDGATPLWWDGVSIVSDGAWNAGAEAIFWGNPGDVSLASGLSANRLSFRGSGFALAGGDLTFAGADAGLHANFGEYATIDSLILGTDGLVKTGGGTVRLTNNANGYTGVTSVSNGILAIADPGALGADASPVLVAGSSTRGFGGGALLLEGNHAGGMNFARDISLQGLGPIGANGVALISVGDNTISGELSNGTGTISTAIASVGGRLTLGDVTLGGTTGSSFMTFGAGNDGGVGSYEIGGVLAGTGSIQKMGGGTLILAPNDASRFTGTLRLTQGSIRVESPSSLGGNNGAGTAAALDLAGDSAILELRMDDPAIGKNIYNRAGGSPIIFVDHAIDGATLGGTAIFGALTFDDGENLVFNGRDGYGVAIGDARVSGGNGNTTFTNNLNGQLGFTGAFWNNADNTGSRTLTIAGNGNTLINGDIIASAAAFDHNLTKTGTGTLTVAGVESTLDGTVSVSAGTLAITDFRSITNNDSTINLGATTGTGSLAIGTTAQATAAGLETAKTVNLAGTTGGGAIYANQSGVNPVIFTANFTAGGTGPKALTLGGTSDPAVENQVRGSIVNNSGSNLTSVVKTGSNTWSLSGANSYTGATLVNNGVLKLQDTFSGGSTDLLADSALVGLGFALAPNTIGSAGGTFQYQGAAGAASAETLGTLIPGAGAGTIRVSGSGGGTASLTFASLDAAPPASLTSAVGGTSTTTLTVASTAGLVPGMKVNGAVGSSTYIVSITNGTQLVVSASQTNLPVGTGLTFTRLNGGGTINFDPDVNGSITLGAVSGAGLLSSYTYFKGADFAYAPDTTNAVLRAPVYDSDAGFVTAGGSLVSTSHNLVGNDTTTGAVTVSSLKINGSQTVTQTGLLTVRTGGAGTSGGILVTGGQATITGTGVSTGGAADLVIRVDGASDVLTLLASITSSTTGGIVKTGAGTLILGGVNAYTTGGTTNLHEGTIQLLPGARLSANTVGLNMRQGTVFDLNGVSVAQSATSSSVGALNGTGTITNTSADPVVFATAASGGVFNGSINEVAGQISYVKMGTTSSQTLTGVSNYTGSTTIGVPGNGTTGSLAVWNLADIGVESSIGRGNPADDATNAASLIFGGTTGGLIYAGTTSVSTNRLFTLAGTVATSGATITNNAVNNQALVFRNTAPIAFANANPQHLQFAGSSNSDNWFYPQITDSGSDPNITRVTKTGTGVWILGNGANSYTGLTTVANGVLRIGSAGALPATSPVVLGSTTSSGTLEMSGSFTRDLAATATPGSNTVTWGGTTGGGGFAAASGKLVVAIGGEGSPTTLTWGAGGFVGTGGTQALLLNSITALSEVEVRNPIDLNGGIRTITVNDNTSTFTDFATITGVISNSTGTAGLTKSGNGTLQLFGANTYNGVTAVTAGTLVVNSLGLSTGLSGGTSLGVNIGANSAAQALTLGNGGTTAGTLQYVGPGETSDRMIRLNTTTGSTQIHADGSGPLILTNVVNDMAVGNKLLYLRGSNTMGNMITSVLANNAPGSNTLGIVADSGATWILTAANEYSGNTTISAGALGAGNDQAFGYSTLLPRNGSLFAYGGDRTLENPLTVASTTSAGTFSFIGDHSLTLNGDWTYTNTTAGHVITNGMTAGATLTINGDMVLNALTGNPTITINGIGETVFNGDITTTTAQNVNLSYSGSGSFTFSGVNPTAGATTLNNGDGTFRLVGAGKIGAGNLTVNSGSFLIESVDQSVGTLTMGNVSGTTATVNVGSGLTLSPTAVTFSGTSTLPATVTGAGTLALGTGGITVTVADNITQAADMVWNIDHLTGSGVLTKAGNGILDLGGVTDNQFSGGYQVDAGAILGLGALSNNIALNGGVYAGSGTFSRALGTGDNQIQWLAGGGGFAAVGGDLTVALSGTPSPLVWAGTPDFLPDGAPLIFGSTAADGATDFTHDLDLNGAVRTVTVIDDTSITTDVAVMSGVLSNGGITKTGNGVLRLSGANTFAGDVTVTGGTLEFDTVSDNGGGPSSLGQGTDGIALSGGATLSFVGETASQSTNRAITTTASSTLSANGTNGASITFAGGITQTGNSSLTLRGTGSGAITGGISQSGGTSADLNVAGGDWTISTGTVTLSDDLNVTGGTLTLQNVALRLNDDIVVAGAGTVLNLNSTGVWEPSNPAGASSGLFVRGGAVVNINADDINGGDNANQVEYILLGDGTTAGTGTLNLNGHAITVPRIDLGAVATAYDGAIVGGGTITSTYATGDYLQGFRFFRGTVDADLVGISTILKQGMGDVSLLGDNRGLTGTVAATRVDAGRLILDFATDNHAKISEVAGLDMRGATLIVDGGTLAATSQSVTGLNLNNGGANQISVTSGAFATTLDLGAITRNNGTGTLRLELPGSGAIVSSTGNHAVTGLLGATGVAYATITDASGTYFAINDGSDHLAPLTYVTPKNDVTTWAAGDHVTDSGGGLFGTLTGSISINSLRFDAAGGSTLTLDPNAVLTVVSGGILRTASASGGPAGISGGTLIAELGEFVFTIDGANQPAAVSSVITGASGLTKSGAGTLSISGNNTYSGITQLQNGTLELSGGNAIADRAAVVLSDDHTSILRILESEAIGTLSGGSNASGLDDLALIDLGANTLTVTETSSATYSGRIAGSGAFVKTGAATLALGGASGDFTGDLIVNQGQLTLATRTIANMSNVGSVTVNGATLSLDFNSGTENANKINNLAPVTLINTGGLDGLRANSDRNDSSKNEVIGVVNLLAGANTVTVSASSTSGTTQRNMTITAARVERGNQATLLVRGQNLGTTLTGAPLSPIHTGRFVNTALPLMLGGGGAAGTQTISIVPWAVGSTSITGTGDSFVTVVPTTGYRPLDLDAEYEQFVADGGVTLMNNVRYSGFTSLVLDGSSKRMNSLLVDNSSGLDPISVQGAGGNLEVNSGAFLFTGSQPITLEGFGGISVGAGGQAGEYIFHVSNTAGAGVTVASPLTSPAADFTKSGEGTLILTGYGSTYTGQTAVNQGVLQIDALDKLGSSGAGGIMLNGGTLRFGGVFDPSTVPFTLGVAATATVAVTAGGTLDTNGFDIYLSSSIGGGGNGGLTKSGAGALTLGSPVSYSGATTVAEGTLAYGTANALPSAMNVVLGGGALDVGAYASTLNELTITANSALNVATSLNFAGNATNSGGSRTLSFTGGGITTFDGALLYLSDTTSSRTLTFAVTDGSVVVNSSIVNGPSSASAIAKTGDGSLELTSRNYFNGATTIGSSSQTGGTVLLTGDGTVGPGALTVTNGSLLIQSVDQTVGTLSMGGGPVGTHATIDIGAGLVLRPSAITFSSTNNNDTSVIGGAGTLDLGDAGITVTVNNSTAVDVDMSWEMDTVVGSGVFTKLGTGTLDIRGVTNFLYNATAYEVNAGAILGLEDLGVNLVLNGGVFEGNGVFNRGLGTAPNQVQWAAGTAGGGFSAAGGDLTVTLSGAPNPLVWGGTPYFVPSGAPLIFGSTTADSIVTLTHNIDLDGADRTISAIDNAALTTDVAVLSGVLSNGGVTKTGNGVLRLGGANTFAGGVTVTGGTLQFSTVSDNGGGPSNLGQGTDGITLSNGRLQFIGGVSQSTDRGMTFTNTGILDASGTGGATITFNGAIAAAGFSLNLEGSGDGILNGLVTTTGTTADLNKNGTGTWTINVAPTIVDNLVVSGGTLIFNALDSFDGDDLFIRTATVKLGINGALTKSMDDFNISTETAGDGILDINGTTGSSTTDVIIGANPANQVTGLTLSGSLIDSVGGGSFSSTTLNVRNGLVSADVATISTTTIGGTISAHDGGINSTSGTISGHLNLGTGSSLVLYSGELSGDATFASGVPVTKNSSNIATISGNNTVAGAGVTAINNGILRLNYGTNTGSKIGDAGLTMNGGALQVEGNAAVPVTVSVGNLTLGSSSDPAPAMIQINTAGASATVQLGGIARNAGGTLRFSPSSPDAHLTTTATNLADAILGGWATYQLGSGAAKFATISGGEIVGFDSTVADSVSTWSAGAHVTDGAGFSGTISNDFAIGSLRFDAAGGASTVTVGSGAVLEVSSGGILVTGNVAAGNPTISGGTLAAGSGNELIVTQDASVPFTVESRLRGTLALTKAGAGTMILRGLTNTSNGILRLTGGTLRLEGGGATGDRAPVVLEPTEGVRLQIGNSEAIGSLSGGNSTNYKNMAVVIDDGQALTINQSAAQTYYGNIGAAAGSVTLTKAGPSTLTITDGIIDLGPAGVLNIIGSRLTLDTNGNNNQLTQIATGATVNISSGGSLFIDHNGITLSAQIPAGRVADDVNFVFNSSGSATDSLYIRQDQNDDHVEVIGGVTFGSGVNSIRIDTSSTGTAALTVIRAGAVSRDNQATFVLRGTNTQRTSSPRAQFQSTALFPGYGTGSGTSLPILPWAVGYSAGGATGDPDTFLTTAGTANAPWRPLNLTTEVVNVTNASGWSALTATQNVMLTASTSGAAAKTMRSLIVATDMGAVDLTGDGAGLLTVQSGGFLFSGSGSSTISGFTGIEVDPAVSEYVFHVMADSAAISSPLTLTGAKVTKSGPGTLTLAANNLGLGGVTLNEGALQISDLDNIGGDTGEIVFAGGTLRLDAAAYSGDDLSSRALTFLLGGGSVDTNGNDIVFNNPFGAGVGGLAKAGAGTLTLNAAAGYSGATTISAGVLRYGVFGALPFASDLVLAGGTLDIAGFGAALGDLEVTANSVIEGGAALTFIGNVEIDGGAARTLTVNNSGGTTFAGELVYLVNNGTSTRTTTINGSGDLDIQAEIANGAATGNLNYAGSGTLTLSGTNSYTGLTTVANGTLRLGLDQSMAGGLAFGASGTAGHLDLANASAAFTTMTVLTNSTTLENLVEIGAGHSLSLTGNVTIGANAASSTTLFTATGAGSFLVNNDDGIFQIGGGTGGTNTNAAIADFSGLATFSVNLGGSGTFRVGDSNSNSTGGTAPNAILTLASQTNTITAGTLNVGQGAGQNSTPTLRLGAGLNTLNADIFNIGGNTTRSGGRIEFDGSEGTLTLRASDGISRAVLNMVNGNIGTGINQTSELLLAGHSADLLISALTMASRSANAGSVTSHLSFDEGTLDVTTFDMAARTGSGTGGATATVAIGGGTVALGSLTMATNTSAGGAVGATFTVTDGDISIGSGSGIAITMGNAAAGRTVSADLHLSGGSVTVGGDIQRAAGAGTENATVTLDGSILALGGHSIGTSGAGSSFVAQSGELTGLAELNGGGLLTKSGTGVLTLGNSNTYTGGTVISEGSLIVANTSGSGTGSGGVSISSGASLGGDGLVSSIVTVAGTISPGVLDGSNASTAGQLTIGGIEVNTGGSLQIQLGGATAQDALAVKAFQDDPGSFVVPASWTDYEGGVTAHDQLLLTSSGAPDIDGLTLQVMPVYLGGYTPAYGDVFQVMDWASLGTLDATGTVNFDLPALGGLSFDTSLFGGFGVLVVVPEPSRLLLLLLGFLAFTSRRRRRLT